MCKLRLLLSCILNLLALFVLTPAHAGGAPETLEYGVAWYPEQWPEASWDADLNLMQEAGFTFVRIAEFSWSTIEPTEGQYDWEWLDHAIAKAKVHNLKIVLATPTAAPPAWMSAKMMPCLGITFGLRRKE